MSKYTFTKETLTEWYKLRERTRRVALRCRMCGNLLDRVTKYAIHIDHIRPHRGDPVLLTDPRNVQALCGTCHNKHKQHHERSNTVRYGADGWPIEEKKQ